MEFFDSIPKNSNLEGWRWGPGNCSLFNKRPGDPDAGSLGHSWRNAGLTSCSLRLYNIQAIFLSASYSPSVPITLFSSPAAGSESKNYLKARLWIRLNHHLKPLRSHHYYFEAESRCVLGSFGVNKIVFFLSNGWLVNRFSPWFLHKLVHLSLELSWLKFPHL